MSLRALLVFPQVVLVLCLEISQTVQHDAARSLRHASANTYYVSDVADRFTAVLQQMRARDAHESLAAAQDEARLRDVIMHASTPQDKDLAELAVESQEESRLERENAEGAVASFVANLRQMGGDGASAHSCGELACGDLGYCDASGGQEGAVCRCRAGYQGNGFVCHPPTALVQHPLIQTAGGALPAQVADLHVSLLHGNNVAVAFRDKSRRDVGFVVIGEVRDGGVRWSRPTVISNRTAAFGPVLVELKSDPGHLAVAYRTKDRGGDGILAFGKHDKGRVFFGQPQVFARYQAQLATLLALPQSRVAVLFAEHQPRQGTATSGDFDMFGASLLAELVPGQEGTAPKSPKLLGKYRFVEGPVSRISVAALSPLSFVVAYRAGQGPNEAAVSTSREATVSIAELWGPELVFTTHPLSLEPNQDHIWARSVVALGNNAFAYTYHSGNEQLTKQTIMQLDKTTHRLVMLQEPAVVSRGFTPFISTVSSVLNSEEHQTASQAALLQSQEHRLFTFVGSDKGAKGQGKICRVLQGGSALGGCKDAGLSAGQVFSVASTLLGDGRAFLLTSDAKGVASYALVGLMGDR